jgi:calcium/calmodulin-dependent protein kinase I
MTNNLRAQYSQHNSFFPCLKKRIHCPVTNITYQLEEQIGSGSAAVVFRAQRVFLNKETQAQTTFVDKATEYAVKVFNLRRMRLHSNYEREQEKLKREMNILKSLHHPCIVNLLHVIETKNKLYFIMELIKGGELFDKIIDKGSFNETEARYIIIQILYALHYLHEKNIIHRDLKPVRFVYNIRSIVISPFLRKIF